METLKDLCIHAVVKKIVQATSSQQAKEFLDKLPVDLQDIVTVRLTEYGWGRPQEINTINDFYYENLKSNMPRLLYWYKLGSALNLNTT